MLSKLTVEQKNILQTMAPWLGLAADIAHSRVTVYLPACDKKFFTVYKQEQPMTQIGNRFPDATGKKIRCMEEPLVNRTLQQNVVVEGLREWELGIFNSFKVFPLRDSKGKAFAALSFDTAVPDDIIIAQAVELLRSMKLPVDGNLNYGRMSPEDGLIVVDKNKIIIAANNEAKHIFEVMDVKDLIGRRTNDIAINWPLVGMVMDTGTAESKEYTMHGRLISMRVLPVVAKAHKGCAFVILQDITELRKKDEELLIKSVVIKEIHHRVKNNLQTIASLLRLQERRAETGEAKNVLKDCICRVNSIAVVHEYLSQQDTGLIDVAKVAKGIYQAILSSMLQPEFKLETNFSADIASLPSEKATSIALILNELLQNAIEHAFCGRDSGRLDVSFIDAGDNYKLEIADDGIGMPAGFDINKTSSLGLKIIKIMAEADLQGSFDLNANSSGGVSALVIIPNGGMEKC